MNFKKELSNFGKSFKIFNIFWIIIENSSVKVKLYFFEFEFPVVKQKNETEEFYTKCYIPFKV